MRPRYETCPNFPCNGKPNQGFRTTSAINSRPTQKDDASGARGGANTRCPTPARCIVGLRVTSRASGLASKRARFTRMTALGREGLTRFPPPRSKAPPPSRDGPILRPPSPSLGDWSERSHDRTGHVTRVAASLKLVSVCGGRRLERLDPKAGLGTVKLAAASGSGFRTRPSAGRVRPLTK